MATRLYLPSSGTPPLPSLGLQGVLWNARTDELVRLPCTTSKTDTALTNKQHTWFATDSTDWCWYQYQSPPLAASYLWTTAEIISVISRVLEEASTVDTKLSVMVTIVSQDGGTVRGYLRSKVSGPGNEFSTSAKTRTFYQYQSAEVTNQIGDRLIIEIGGQGATPTLKYFLMRMGDPSATSDFAFTEDLTTDLCPWVEFTQNVTFSAESGGTLSVNITEPITVGEASIGGLLGMLALSMLLAIGVGEVVTPQIYRQAAIIETVTATESPPTVSLAPLAISITEPCTVGEARTLVLSTITLSAVHGVTVGESQTIGGIIPNTAIIEAIAVGEARTLGVGPPIIGITEPVTTGETATGKASTLIAAITEPVTVTEIPTVEREAEPTRLISISEPIGVAEVPTEIVGGLAKSISEPITVGEVQTLIAGALLKAITEPVTIGESQTLISGTLAKSISESIATGETQALIAGALVKSISEPATVTEAQALIVEGPKPSISEGVAVGEARTLIAEGPKASITEPVSIAEVRTGIVGTAKIAIIEPISVVEVAPIVAGLGGDTRLISITEPITVGEVQALLSGTVAGAVIEPVTVTESRAGQVGTVLAEAISTIQAEEVPAGQVGELAGAITENVQVTESQTIAVQDAIKPVTIDILESISVADIPTFFMYDETGEIVIWDVVLNRRAGVRSVEPRQRIFNVRSIGGRT